MVIIEFSSAGFGSDPISTHYLMASDMKVIRKETKNGKQFGDYKILEMKEISIKTAKARGVGHLTEGIAHAKTLHKYALKLRNPEHSEIGW